MNSILLHSAKTFARGFRQTRASSLRWLQPSLTLCSTVQGSNALNLCGPQRWKSTTQDSVSHTPAVLYDLSKNNIKQVKVEAESRCREFTSRGEPNKKESKIVNKLVFRGLNSLPNPFKHLVLCEWNTLWGVGDLVFSNDEGDAFLAVEAKHTATQSTKQRRAKRSKAKKQSRRYKSILKEALPNKKVFAGIVTERGFEFLKGEGENLQKFNNKKNKHSP